MVMPALIALLVTTFVALLSYGASISMRLREEQAAFGARISQDGAPQMRSGAPSPSPTGGLKGGTVRIARILGDRFKPKNEEEISRIETAFLNAGLRGRNALVLFFGVKVLLAAVFLCAFMVVKFLVGTSLSAPSAFSLACLATLIGFYGPNLWLSRKIAHRWDKIIVGFPDALDLMVVCTEAGMGLDAALKRVGEEMRLSNKVLSEEFAILNLELRAGKSRPNVLRSLGRRIGLEDVDSLMTLLIQTDKFGTSVAQALRVHADAMRTKRMQMVEEIANKLPVKLLFPTIFCIFPALFLIVLGPALIAAARIWGY
jgi:tight adherence protein C